MVDVVESLAALHLPQNPADDWFSSSPRQRHLQHSTSSSAISLFQDSSTASSKQGHQSEATSEAEKQAAWSAIVGDLFQAVIEHLPAHTAQHAMLVCRQWHDSVTNGLICLRPRALRLDCINSRSATDHDCTVAASICMHHMSCQDSCACTCLASSQVSMHVHGCCRFAALRTLDLSGIPRLQDAHLQGLSQLQLNCITLVGCEHITAMGLHHVGLAHGLMALDLTGCCKVPHAGSLALLAMQIGLLYVASPDVVLHGFIWRSESTARVIQS